MALRATYFLSVINGDPVAWCVVVLVRTDSDGGLLPDKGGKLSDIRSISSFKRAHDDRYSDILNKTRSVNF